MRRHILGESERRGYDILVQEVDVITLGVGRIVIEWEISG
jgi:hypothetical protein